MPNPASVLQKFQLGEALVEIYASSAAAANAAAARTAQLMRTAISNHGRARVIAATGNSQIAFIGALVKQKIEWASVELFHMDEYVGINPDHLASFRYWIRTRIEDRVHPLISHYLGGDAPDLVAEALRYAQLLEAAPIDVAFVGFGENGHIAFNDPPVANFYDRQMVKIVALDDACRRQQVGEGHFKDIASVPARALTITCPGLFRAEAWICNVPDLRKAEAVKNALQGPIFETCPASLVQRHPNSCVFLDCESASLLSTSATAGH